MTTAARTPSEIRTDILTLRALIKALGHTFPIRSEAALENPRTLSAAVTYFQYICGNHKWIGIERDIAEWDGSVILCREIDHILSRYREIVAYKHHSPDDLSVLDNPDLLNAVSVSVFGYADEYDYRQYGFANSWSEAVGCY